MSNILQVLRDLEWAGRKREDFGHGDYSNVPCCPSCGGIDWDTVVPGNKIKHKWHEADCRLAGAIQQEQNADDES